MPMPSWLSGTSLPRTLGWVTAAYSAALIVRPKLLAAPCGFVDSRGEIPREVATVIAAVGARNVASGLAMALVPAGKPLQTALAVRVVADLSDAVIFAVGIPDTSRAWRIAGFAAVWGALCAASARTTGAAARTGTPAVHNGHPPHVIELVRG